MRTMQTWLDEYGDSHRNPVNKKIHWICVPLIMLSTIGLFWSIPHSYFPDIGLGFPLNWGIIFILFTMIFYVRLSVIMFIGMSLIGALLILGNLWLMQTFDLPLWQTSLLIFVPAWLGQFIGHKIEGKKPSFFKDVQFLLIGPAWLLSFIYQKLGIRY